MSLLSEVGRLISPTNTVATNNISWDEIPGNLRDDTGLGRYHLVY